MKITYEGQPYDVPEVGSWTTLEWIKLERHTGKRPMQIFSEASDATPVGVHCLVWVTLRRAGVDVAWDDLQLPWLDAMDELRGEPMQAPPDPSMASTEAPTAGKQTRSATVRSRKK